MVVLLKGLLAGWGLAWGWMTQPDVLQRLTGTKVSSGQVPRHAQMYMRWTRYRVQVEGNITMRVMGEGNMRLY